MAKITKHIGITRLFKIIKERKTEDISYDMLTGPGVLIYSNS